MKSQSLLLFSVLAAALPPLAVGEEESLGELLVTAQKREERLIDVPMSITALSGEDVVQRGLTSVQELAFAVPGMATREDGPGSYTIFMRGLSNQYGDGALVSVYLDEVPLSLTGYDQLGMRLFDLDRVEVLKGPQGTLYGQGSVAGTVRYITRRPELNAVQGSLELSEAEVSGGDSRETVTGVVNVPVVEDVFGLRLAAHWEQGGGWQDQPQAGIENGNDQDVIDARLSALWRATEALDIETMVMIQRAESKLGLGYENPDRTITVGIDRSDVLIPKEFDYDIYNLNVSYDFGSMQLLSASTYIDHEHHYPFSYIGGPETIYGGSLEGTDARVVTAEQFSQEVRLVSTAAGRLQWTLGGFYRTLNRDLLAIYDTLFAGVVYPDAVYIADDTFESYSLFADASFDVTRRLELGAGVRYFTDDQSTFDGALTEKDTFDSVDPRVYASFAVTEDVKVYASVAEGFRSGGFNRGDLPNHDPESLLSYEIGAKGTVQEGLFDFEVAAYYSDYSDMLRRGLVFVESTATFESLTTNIGTVEVKGVEAGITWRPIDALLINATGSYIDSEVTEVNATDATNIVGDPVDYVPETSYTLSAQYGFDWGVDRSGFVRMDYYYRDEISYIDRSSFPPANLPQVADSIGLLDARIGLDWGKTRLELFGTNLTDENRWIDPYYAWTNANRTRPRTVGLLLAFNFD